MKILTLTIFFFIINTLTGQIQLLDSCGLDNEIKLNKYESDYLNSTFALDYFTFENKKIKFRYANYGHFSSDKKGYFNDVKEWRKKHTRIHEDIIVLTEEEKIKYGDFDAIIISWSKFPVTEKSRGKFLKKELKRKKNNR